MHSGKRGEIEKEIKVQMAKLLEGRGFVIEAILLKSITLPKGLYAAIEAKLQAEQEAQQMKFVLQREEKEAERHSIKLTRKKRRPFWKRLAHLQQLHPKM